MSACFHVIGKCCADKTEVKNMLEKGNKDLKTTMYNEDTDAVKFDRLG
jgi:hypothetical protein